MRRVRLLVRVTYHPDAGGTRRQGEVLDLSDELGEHWIRGAVAEDATDEDLTAPVVPIEPIGPGLWPDGSVQDWSGEGASDEGAVINSDNRPAGTPQPATVGPAKQRRGGRQSSR